MISSVRKSLLAAFLCGVLVGPVAPAHVSAKVSVSKYSNCTKLQKVWPQGVAATTAKARLQAVRPAVNAVGYSKNRHLDTDRDGTACEVKRSTVRTKPGTVATVATTTLPIRCPVFGVNVNLEIVQSSLLSEVGSGRYSYRVTREYYLKITNSSSSPIGLAFANLKSTYNGNQEYAFTADLTGTQVSEGSEITRRFTYQQIVSPVLSGGNNLFDTVISTVSLPFLPMIASCR
jgi:hypothetical protein